MSGDCFSDYEPSDAIRMQLFEALINRYLQSPVSTQLVTNLAAASYQDPGLGMMQCIDSGKDTNTCASEYKQPTYNSLA